MTALITSLPTEFQVAQVDYAAIAPMLIVFGGAIVGVLVEAFAPRSIRYAAQVGLSVVTLVAALVVLVTVSVDAQGITLERAVVVDGLDADSTDAALAARLADIRDEAVLRRDDLRRKLDAADEFVAQLETR